MKRKTEHRIDWENGFCAATEWELQKNRDDLQFDTQHILGKQPMRVDMLVIRKNSDVEIQNEIGKIFKKHNLIEFKGHGDKLNIDVYHKVLAYAHLYKSLEKVAGEIPTDEVTITIIREAYPRNLFRRLRQKGIDIAEKYKGIFYLTGNVMFATQIIVTKRLDGEKHASLKILSRSASEKDINTFLKKAKSSKIPEDCRNADTVLDISSLANKELFSEIRRDQSMKSALMEIMQEDFEAEYGERIKEAKKEADKRVKEANERANKAEIKIKIEKEASALEFLKTGVPIETVANCLKLPLNKVKEINDSLNSMPEN